MNYKNPCLLGMIYHNRSFTYELLESMPTNIKNPSTVAYRNFVTDLLEYVHPHVVYDKSVFIFFKKRCGKNIITKSLVYNNFIKLIWEGIHLLISNFISTVKQ